MSDHFSSVASAYAVARPTYPPALFDWLAKQTPAHDLAWDAGAGNGQATLALAERFARVLATDISAEQVRQAPQRPNIIWRVTDVETGLDAASCDLVTIAQALHWFNLDTFYAEARRVLKPRGVIAAWTYDLLTIADQPAINIELNAFYDAVGDWWPPERRHVENGYTDLSFPFDRIPVPRLTMQAEWSFDHLLVYLKSWSAVARMTRATGENPVDTQTGALRAAWGDPGVNQTMLWPLTILAGQV